jgi:hypothetical protein
MKLQQSRKAFSMLTALVIIILMATVSMLVFNLSGKMVKGTTTQFLREQAMLLAKSYTEYAVMAITANDRNTTTNCITGIEGSNIIRSIDQSGYRVRVNIFYIGNNTEVQYCTDNILSDDVTTPETPLSAIIDVYVEYKDIDSHVSDIDDRPWITYHRRTLQKI